MRKTTLAAAVMAESRRYSRAVRKRVLTATGVVAGGMAYLGIIAVLYRSQQSSTMILEIRPFSGATIVGIYTGLGATVVALQFGARTVLGQSTSDVRATARNLVQRSFVEALAWVALLTSITIGLLTAYWYADAPAHLEIGRTFGALLASGFLAFTAAETQLLMASPLTEELLVLSQQRRIRLLSRTLRDRLPAEVPARTLWLQRGLLFVVTPAVSLALSELVLPTTSVWVLVGRALIILGATVSAYALVRSIWQAVVERNGSTASAIVIFSALLGVAILTSVGESELSSYGGRLTAGELGRGFLGLWVIAVLLPMTSMCLAALRGRHHAGVIVHDVRAATQRRLSKLRAPSAGTEKPPLGRMVPWAMGAAVVFPFGIILGRLAAKDAKLHGHRGARRATIAAWACAVLTAVGIGVIIAIACQP